MSELSFDIKCKKCGHEHKEDDLEIADMENTDYAIGWLNDVGLLNKKLEKKIEIYHETIKFYENMAPIPNRASVCLDKIKKLENIKISGAGSENI